MNALVSGRDGAKKRGVMKGRPQKGLLKVWRTKHPLYSSAFSGPCAGMFKLCMRVWVISYGVRTRLMG